jgi:hypothetical protein
MQTVPADIARDNPEAYIARDRRRALVAHEPMPDRVAGSALFADISGFTPLTEVLATELGPQRGPDELTAHIGRVFHAVIEQLDRRGGDVIYFSGDAITCWLDGDDGTRAVAASVAMQEAMDRVGRITTPAGTVVGVLDGTPRTVAYDCESGALQDPVETTTTANSGLTFSTSTGLYQYNWKTAKSARGCFRFKLALDDGSIHVALFRLK